MAKGFIRKGLKAAGIAAIVVVLLLLALRLAVPVVAVRVANSQLSDLLGTAVRIGKIEIQVLRGSLALKDIQVRQPEGFGEDDLLVVPEIRARLRLGSLLRFPVRVEELLLASPRIRIVRNREGDLDLDEIVSAVLSSSNGIDQEDKNDSQQEEGKQGYPVIIEEAAVRNLSLSYKDYSHEESSHEAKLEHLTFELTNLSLESSSGEVRSASEKEAQGPGGTDTGTNRGSLTIRNIHIEQPPGFDGDPLLTISEVDLKAHVPSLFKPHFTLEEVSLKDVAIRLARNRSGTLNLEAVLSRAIPRTSGAAASEENVSSEQQEGEPPPDWKILLKRFTIQALSFLYSDRSFQDEPFETRVSDLFFEVTDLVLGSGEATAVPRQEVAQQGGDADEVNGPKGSLVVRDLHIDQPQGFSGDTLLSWPELKVDFLIGSVFDPSITIEDADLYQPSIHLAYDKAHQGNVKVLLSKAIPRSKEEPEKPKTTPATEPSDQSTRIHLRKFAIHDLGLAFTDTSYEEKPMEVHLEAVDLEVKDLTYDPSRGPEKTLPATARMTGRQVQTPFADAPLGFYAKVGTLGDQVPSVNGSLQLGGLELAPIGHTLPPGAEQAIGGDALDLSVDLALAPDLLDCDARVKSIGGSSLSLHIGGTPENPAVDTSNMLFLVFFRSGGALGNVAGKVGGAGVEVADTAIGSVKVVGTGTAKTLGSVGVGILGTAKGLATADVGGMAEGLKKTTVGTVKEGAGTAAGAAGEVKGGAVDVGSAGIGKQQAEVWRKAVEDRWEKAWAKAQSRVDRMPYPSP